MSASGHPAQTNATARWVLAFTNPTAVPSGGDVRIVLPPLFSTVTNATCDVNVQAQELAGETATVSGQDLVCELGSNGISANSGVSVSWTQIRNPTTEQTNVPFVFETRDASNAVIDQHTAVNGTVVPSPLKDFTAAATDATAGRSTTWRFTFTTANAVAATGDVRIVLPSGFATSAGGTTTCDVLDEVSENTTVVSATEVVCNLNGVSFAVGERVRMDLTNVQNPASAGAAGAFVVETRNATDRVHDNFTTFRPIVNAAPLRNLNVSAPFQTTGAVETWTFNFTLSTALAAQGKFRLVLPAGFHLGTGAATQCDVQGKTGESATIVSTTEALCNLGSNAFAANDTVSMTLSNVRNPVTAQTTAPFAIETRSKDEVVYDGDGADVETIAPHGFTEGPTVEAASTTASAITHYTFRFKPFNDWESNGNLEVTFPGGYGFDATGPGSTAAQFTAGGSGELARANATAPRLVFLRLSGGSVVAAGTPVAVRVTGVYNPPAGSGNATFVVSTTNNVGALHDTGSAFEVTLWSGGPGNGTGAPNATGSNNTTGERKGFLPDGLGPAQIGALVAVAAALVRRRR